MNYLNIVLILKSSRAECHPNKFKKLKPPKLPASSPKPSKF